MTAADTSANHPPERMGREYTHAERMRVVGGILTCLLLAALDQTVVLPAIPQMAASLPGASHLSWVVSAYLLTSTVSTPICGKLSDQFGRRATLVPGIVVFLLSSIFCAAANSVLMLVIARALQGLGGGALFAVTQAAIADVIPPRERGRYQAWFAGTWAFASVAGPLAGGFVTQNFSWRWIFWANVPLGLVAMVLCIRGLAGIPAAGRRSRIDYPGALLLTVSVGTILFGLSSGGVTFSWFSWQMLAIIVSSALLLALLSFQQRHASAPLLPGSLLASRNYRHILAISMITAAGLFGATFLIPLLMQWVYHASPAASGLEIVPYLFLNTIGAIFAGQWLRRTGRPRMAIITGKSISVIGFLVMAALPENGGIALPVIVTVTYGFGIGMIMPSSLVGGQSLSPPRDVGVATGTLLLLRAMGGAFGATLAGVCLAFFSHDLVNGFRLAFFLLAVLFAIGVVVTWRMENFALRTSSLEHPAPIGD